MVENAGVENAGVDSSVGKCTSEKCRSNNVWKAVKQKIIILNNIGTDYKIGLRLCVCVCPSASTFTVAFLDRFSSKLA